MVEARTPAPRQPIRDAATLVIVDPRAGSPRVLVGRRSSAHVFMPGKLVFPGGRIDRTDTAVARSCALPQAASARLLTQVRKGFGERRAIALALAAIRETYEETGIMIGQPAADFSSRLPFWSDFAREGVAPDPAALVPFARALTPPQRVRRYDTRFFAVPAGAIARQAPFEERPTDELEGLRWIGLQDMLAEDLAPITRIVLGDLAERLSRGTLFQPEEPMPFYRRRSSSADFERILL